MRFIIDTAKSRAFLIAAVVLAVVAGIAASLYLFVGRRPQITERRPVRWPTVVSTIAGAGAPGLQEGRGIAVGFCDPFGVAVGAAGDTWLTDAGDNNAIWRIGDDGTAAIVAGGCEGFTDGQGRAACFNTPSGIAIDGQGNLIVADTANNTIRRVTPVGRVTTVAGAGEPGMADGVGREARFNGPIGVAVAPDGRIIVADTYNDRIRAIGSDGRVSTIAGPIPPATSSAPAIQPQIAGPGYRDGNAADALFDTPSGVAVDRDGVIYVADTGNDAIRRIDRDGRVTTIAQSIVRPVGIAVERPTPAAPNARDRSADERSSAIYVADAAGRILLIGVSPEPVLLSSGSADVRFRNPCGLAVAPDGSLRVADTDNYLVRRLTRSGESYPPGDIDFTPVPGLNATTLRMPELFWPLDPQQQWHEVAATLGEARGSLGGDGRERLHAGVDVQGPMGAVVRAVRDEKAQRPISAYGFGSLVESLRVGVVAYVHVRVGRSARGVPLDPTRFAVVSDEFGRPARIRVRRGTRFHVGDPVGTINPFAHVHLGVGPPGAEINALELSPPSFTDRIAPTIVADGVQLYSESGERLGLVQPPSDTVKARRRRPRPPTVRAPVPVTGRVSIVVEAYDRVDGNRTSRRLGVYALGYQVLHADGTPRTGFEQPITTIQFDRLPSDPDAPKMIYAQGSGITVYGNKTTRFRYIVTNTLRDGVAERGTWDTSTLAPGEYRLRVFAADVAGNRTVREVRVVR